MKVTTSFQLDYRTLVVLQKRAKERGFSGWGSYLRSVLDFHVLVCEPDLLPELVQSQRGRMNVKNLGLSGNSIFAASYADSKQEVNS